MSAGTWVTLTVARRERGRVATITRTEQTVSRREHRPTLLSHTAARSQMSATLSKIFRNFTIFRPFQSDE